MKQQWHVLIGSRSFGKAFPNHLERLRQAGCVVHPNSVGRAYREEELLEVLPGMDAIITGTDELTANAINHSEQLKAIVKHGVGLETIDLNAASKRGIVVSATPGIIHDSVADLTMALILALARWIIPAHASVASGGWKPFFGVELNEKVLGIVGLGRIGKAVCRRALGFGMVVTASDPYPDTEFGAANTVSFRSLEELLEISDFVSLHASAEQAPNPLIGASELDRMKESAFLINTARGVLVDEESLADALINKRLAGAGIDAFVHEPPENSPLLALDNVVLCPHLGGRTVDGQRKMGEMAIENCMRSLRGEKPLYQVVLP